MKRFKDWRFRNKLLVSFLASAALAAGPMFAVILLAAGEFTGRLVPQQLALTELRVSAFELISEYRGYIMDPARPVFGPILDDVGAMHRRFRGRLRDYGETAHLSDDGRRLFASIDEAERRMERVGQYNFAKRRELDELVAGLRQVAGNAMAAVREARTEARALEARAHAPEPSSATTPCAGPAPCTSSPSWRSVSC